MQKAEFHNGKMVKAIFRVDASDTIGLGHLMRCFALAECLQNKKEQCIFVIKDYSPDIRRLISQRGYRFEIIRYVLDGKNDALRLITYIKKYKPRFVILDSYSFDAAYLKTIKNNTECFLVSIYGILKKDYFSDVIINYNPLAKNGDYLKRIKKDMLLLLGLKYFLLRSEFIEAKRNRRKAHGSKLRLLVSFGGSDPKNITFKVLNALRGISDKLELRVILGVVYANFLSIERFCRKHFTDFKIFRNPGAIAGLMADVDMAISAGGVTSLELAYLGIPTVIIAVAENQLENAYYLSKNRIAVYLGRAEEVSEKTILVAIKRIFNNPRLRIYMSSRAQKFIDGNGAYRIKKSLEGFYEKVGR